MICEYRAMVELEFGGENRSTWEETFPSATLSTTDTRRLAFGRTHFSGIRRKVSDMLSKLKRLRAICVRLRVSSKGGVRHCSVFTPPYSKWPMCIAHVCVWRLLFIPKECSNNAIFYRSGKLLPSLHKVWGYVNWWTQTVVHPGIFSGGFNKFRWGQRERGSGGGSPLVRGSGGSCNLVQEISFHIVKFS
jgi:hypothetical protein